LGGVTSQTTQTRVAQPSENAISQSDSNSETELSEVSESEDPKAKSVEKAAKQKDASRDVYAFVINVLAGIFWNSLWHDLFFDIRFSSSVVSNFVGLCLALLLAVLILWVDWQLYQQIKQYSSDQGQKKERLFLYMALICAVGLGLGGLVYYLIRLGLLYLSNVSIGLPK